MRVLTRSLASVLACLAASCSRNPEPEAGPAYRYSVLTDTIVCVVDRTASRGLRDLGAKKEADGRVVLLVRGEIQPLEAVHPVSLVAGYGGSESWFRSDAPITLGEARYVKVEQERRIQASQLGQAGEYQGIPVFGDPADEPPPDALYVPVRPGCIFQAYVREDLLGDAGDG